LDDARLSLSSADVTVIQASVGFVWDEGHYVYDRVEEVAAVVVRY